MAVTVTFTDDQARCLYTVASAVTNQKPLPDLTSVELGYLDRALDRLGTARINAELADGTADQEVPT